MRSALIPGLLIALAGAVSALAAQPADGSQAPRTQLRSGAVQLTLNLNTNQRLPDGSAILCKARISPNGQGLQLLNHLSAAPMETATGRGLMTPSGANCTVELPFSWALDNPGTGLVLRYEVEALGVQSAPAGRHGGQAHGEMATSYPPQGSRSHLSVSIAF